ncbi:hypothetical protein GH714_006690 [Hevea brasiliensis]|uniref:Uncharacterized protein n=1 Tax=Hevea brasiliensis TaxID=3981 RepID=A0A6A6LF13_HEVBR|nr:hypothetical protein GH714_006690 [Hevea brasiliensis]
MSPKTDEEMDHMSSVPYSSVGGSIMYAMGTTDVSLTFDRTKMSDSVVGSVDSDFVGDLDKRRSLTVICLLFLKVLSLEDNIASYSCFVYHRAEYMALAEAVKEVLWLQGLEVDSLLAQVNAICALCYVHTLEVSPALEQAPPASSKSRINLSIAILLDIATAFLYSTSSVATDSNCPFMFLRDAFLLLLLQMPAYEHFGLPSGDCL